MCQNNSIKDICVGCIFSLESCIKKHQFLTKAKGKQLKLKESYLSCVFLFSQYYNLNSNDLYATVLRLMYSVKHKIHCFIAIHPLSSGPDIKDV